MVQSLGEAQNALTGWRRALEVVGMPPASGAGAQLPDGPVGIEVREVSARYGEGPLVLREISVRIEPGEHVAVVGRTGSGKSTFAKLLTRRVEPVTGEVRLSGIPVDRIDDAGTRGRVVIIPQDPFLFDDTLYENLRLGAPTADRDIVCSAVAALGIEGWVAGLPDGLDTRVGLRGERLSVGERQLVALARTALVDPDLVILDEATSGIDPATDVAVQSAMRAVTAGRTTVSIAHRMITAADADRILVFDDGRIVQNGPHDALRRTDGLYQRLYRVWEDATRG